MFSDLEMPGRLPANENARQAAVVASGALQSRGDRRLARISEEAAGAYGVPISAVSIISQDRQILLARCGMDHWETTRLESFCAVAIHRPGEALLVADTLEDWRFSAHPAVSAAPFLRFYAGMPFVDRSGYPLGALCIADTSPLDQPIDLTRLMMLAREVERVFG